MRTKQMNGGIVVAVAVMAGAALLMACGGDDGDDASAAPDPTGTRAVATATRAAEQPVATPSAAVAEPTAPAPTQPAAAPTQPPAAPTPPSAAPTLPPPPPAQPTTPPPPPAPPTATNVTITARDVKFVPPSVAVALGMVVTAIFNNDDAGVAHDLVLYDPSGTKVGSTEVFTGPGIRQFTFTASTAGSYGMKCTIHRNMGGSIVVQ